MRVKNKHLEWYALRHDFNTDKIYNYNIFGQEFIDKLYKEYQHKNLNSLEDLKEFTKRYLLVHYWSRSEHELAVGGLSTKPEDYTKIDIYSQVMPNIDRIVSYINKELDIKLN